MSDPPPPLTARMDSQGQRDKSSPTESQPLQHDSQDTLVDSSPTLLSKPSKSFEATLDNLPLPLDSHPNRSPSPGTLSNVSFEEIRTGRSPSRQGVYRGSSQSPAPPKTFKERLKAAWVRNKGLALVLLAQVFGTLMNVTTRLLETEGDGGKGMHPFQVHTPFTTLDHRRKKYSR